jgi:transcriptional regulator with XRE-family HTH domain
MTQAQMGALVDLSQAEISRLERGRGAGTSIETWVAIGIALERPIAIGFSRDVVEPLNDAGHLAAQELVIRLARAARWTVSFEAPSNPSDPRHATDLVLERTGEIVLVEIWNRMDDLGAAVRSSDRKVAEAIARDHGTVRSCWLLVDTAANREIVRRYPAILRARFDGSSVGWVDALASGRPTPTSPRPALAWVDPRSGRLAELRLRAADLSSSGRRRSR